MNRRIVFLLLILTLGVSFVQAAVTNYHYRTVKGGTWVTDNPWERSTDKTNWTKVTSNPDYDDQTITIRHAITLGAIRKLDQMTIENLASLTVGGAIHITIEPGDGTDLTIENGGYLIGPGNITNNENADILVKSGGIFDINKLGIYTCTFTNNGTLTNYGSIVGEGKIKNKSTGTIDFVSGEYSFSGSLTNNGTVILHGNQLNGIVTNKKKDAVIKSDRVDFMNDGTLTSDKGSTIEYTSVVNIPTPATSNYYKRLHLSAPGVYYLTGDLTGLEYLTLGENTYLHKNGFNLDAGIDIVSDNNKKCNAPERIIDWPHITVSTENPAIGDGTISQSTTKHPIYRFVLDRDDYEGQVDFNKLTFTTSGDATALDIKKFQLWTSARYDSLHLASHVGIDVTTDLGLGTHTIDNFNIPLLKGGKRYFWITADLHDDAVVGHNLVVNKLEMNGLEFGLDFEYEPSSPQIIKIDEAKIGGTQTIGTVNTVLTTGNQVPDQDISKGSIKNPIYRFELKASGSNALTALSVNCEGISNSAFSNYSLYGSHTNNLATALKIGEFEYTTTEAGLSAKNGDITFTEMNYPLISGHQHYFWITVDVADEDHVSGSITVSALDKDNVSLTSGIKPTLIGTISAGGTQTIVTAKTTLSSANPAIAAAIFSVGSNNNPFYAFNLTTSGSNTLQSVSVKPIGSVYFDPQFCKLYTSTLDVFSSATLLGNATGSNGDTIFFENLNQLLSDGTTQYYWFTVDIGANDSGRTIQVNTFTTDNFTMLTGDKDGTAYAGGQHSTGNPLLHVKTVNPAIPSATIQVGAEINPIYRFSVERGVDSGVATINTITFSTAGTYAVNNTMFSLFKDNLTDANKVQAVVTKVTDTKYTFNLNTPISISPNSTQDFWISISTSQEGPGQTVQVLALTDDSFTMTGARVHTAAHDGAEQIIGEVKVFLASGTYTLENSYVSPGYKKSPLQSFSLQSCGNISLNQLNFSTNGSCTNADITRLQLWTSLDNDFSTAGQIGDDINLGTHQFTNIGMSLVPSEYHYFWITADVSSTATLDRTIQILGLSTNDISVSSGNKEGSATIGGEQKIVELTDWRLSKGQMVSQNDEAGKGYQVKVIVYRTTGMDDGMKAYVGNNCRKDFGDIRFFEGDTELPYWIESVNFGENATFWVQLDGDLSDGDIDLTMLYGNEGATTTSDGTATFEFFDDFNRADNSLAKWNIHKTEDNSTISIPKGLNHIRLGECNKQDGGSYGHVVLGSDKSYSNFSDGAIEFKFRVCVDAITEVGLRGNFQSNTGYKLRSDARIDKAGIYGGHAFLEPPYYDWEHMLDSPDSALNQPIPLQWYHGLITAKGDNLIFYRDGQEHTHTAYAYNHGPGEISLQNHYGNKADFDWIFVRKFASVEPYRSPWSIVPIALDATAQSSSGFTARWESSLGAISYKLSVYSPDNSTPLIIENIQNTAARVNDLQSGATYTYVVQAKGADGNYSPDSNIISVDTTSETAGTGATTIINNSATAYIPPVNSGIANNDVDISSAPAGTDDIFIVIAYHEEGYGSKWPNARLSATITSTNPSALYSTFKIYHEGMTPPKAAAYCFVDSDGDGDWHHLDPDSFTNDDYTIFTVTGTPDDSSSGKLVCIMDDGSGTLPVELSSFTARLNPYGKVKIEWVTQTETNVMGYRLYRNNIKNLDEALLLDALIEGRNTSHAQVYTYVDNDVLEPGNNYYWLECMDYDGTMQYYGPVTVNISGDSDSHNQAPIIAGINHTYPNPFNPDIHITFGVPEDTAVKLTIYNIKGQFVADILSENFKRGNHTFTWTGRDARGRQLASGLYFLRMEMDKKTWIKKITMSK